METKITLVLSQHLYSSNVAVAAAEQNSNSNSNSNSADNF